MIREDEDVVALGDYCEKVLEAPHFNSLFDEFKSDRFNMMLSTKPHETKMREGIYAEMNALGEFLALMKSYVDKRNDLIEPNQSIASDSDD